MSRGVKRTFSEMNSSEASSPGILKVGSSDQAVAERIGNMSPSMSPLYFFPISFLSGPYHGRTAWVERGCQQDSPKGVARVIDGVFGVPNSKNPDQRTNVSLYTSSLFCSVGSDSEDDEELCKILKESNLNS